MRLNVNEWKPFLTSKLFSKLIVGKANQQLLNEGNQCFYVGAKKIDNGVMLHCLRDESLMMHGNCIVFICNGQGSVGYANYMDVDFIGTADIVAGYNDYLNEYIGIFLATIYSQERPKYSFGRKWKTHLKDTIIHLPAKHDVNGNVSIDSSKKWSDFGYIPDWGYMEKYIKSLRHKPLTTKHNRAFYKLDVSNWKYFLLKDICKITMGNKMDFADMIADEPMVNFVDRSSDNNGIAGQVDFVYDRKGIKIEPYPPGCVTVALGGSLGSTFLQRSPFYTSQNVSVLEFSDDVTDYAKLFLCTLIHNESRYKYFPFGRELNTHIRNDFGFTLPVDSDGNPDWLFMENYIKSLPYGDRI